MYYYSLKKKRIDIEVQKMSLKKEVQQQQLALQKREILFCKFKARISPDYLALKFSFVSSKSFSNKKPTKTVY